MFSNRIRRSCRVENGFVCLKTGGPIILLPALPLVAARTARSALRNEDAYRVEVPQSHCGVAGEDVMSVMKGGTVRKMGRDWLLTT